MKEDDCTSMKARLPNLACDHKARKRESYTDLFITTVASCLLPKRAAFGSLRDDSLFQSLLRRMNFPE